MPAGRKYRGISCATVTRNVSDSCAENSVSVQRFHRMGRRNKAHSGAESHISHHRTVKRATRNALYRALKSTVSGCDMLHIACRYVAYHRLIQCISHDTCRSVAFPVFQNEQPARIFPSVKMLPHTFIQRHSDIRHTSRAAPGQAPYGRHEKQKSRLHSRLSIDYTITLCIFNYKLSLAPVMQVTPLSRIRLQS